MSEQVKDKPTSSQIVRRTLRFSASVSVVTAGLAAGLCWIAGVNLERGPKLGAACVFVAFAAAVGFAVGMNACRDELDLAMRDSKKGGGER